MLQGLREDDQRGATLRYAADQEGRNPLQLAVHLGDGAQFSEMMAIAATPLARYDLLEPLVASYDMSLGSWKPPMTSKGLADSFHAHCLALPGVYPCEGKPAHTAKETSPFLYGLLHILQRELLLDSKKVPSTRPADGTSKTKPIKRSPGKAEPWKLTPLPANQTRAAANETNNTTRHVDGNETETDFEKSDVSEDANTTATEKNTEMSEGQRGVNTTEEETEGSEGESEAYEDSNTTIAEGNSTEETPARRHTAQEEDANSSGSASESNVTESQSTESNASYVQTTSIRNGTKASKSTRTSRPSPLPASSFVETVWTSTPGQGHSNDSSYSEHDYSVTEDSGDNDNYMDIQGWSDSDRNLTDTGDRSQIKTEPNTDYLDVEGWSDTESESDREGEQGGEGGKGTTEPGASACSEAAVRRLKEMGDPFVLRRRITQTHKAAADLLEKDKDAFIELRRRLQQELETYRSSVDGSAKRIGGMLCTPFQHQECLTACSAGECLCDREYLDWTLLGGSVFRPLRGEAEISPVLCGHSRSAICSVFLNATIHDDVDAMGKTLKDVPQAIECVYGKLGMTTLMVASYVKKLKAIRFLLEQDCNQYHHDLIHVQDNSGHTAVWYALMPSKRQWIEAEKVGIVSPITSPQAIEQLLLGVQTDYERRQLLDAPDNHGYSPLHMIGRRISEDMAHGGRHKLADMSRTTIIRLALGVHEKLREVIDVFSDMQRFKLIGGMQCQYDTDCVTNKCVPSKGACECFGTDPSSAFREGIHLYSKYMDPSITSSRDNEEELNFFLCHPYWLELTREQREYNFTAHPRVADEEYSYEEEGEETPPPEEYSTSEEEQLEEQPVVRRRVIIAKRRVGSGRAPGRRPTPAEPTLAEKVTERKVPGKKTPSIGEEGPTETTTETTTEEEEEKETYPPVSDISGGEASSLSEEEWPSEAEWSEEERPPGRNETDAMMRQELPDKRRGERERGGKRETAPTAALGTPKRRVKFEEEQPETIEEEGESGTETEEEVGHLANITSPVSAEEEPSREEEEEEEVVDSEDEEVPLDTVDGASKMRAPAALAPKAPAPYARPKAEESVTSSETETETGDEYERLGHWADSESPYSEEELEETAEEERPGRPPISAQVGVFRKPAIVGGYGFKAPSRLREEEELHPVRGRRKKQEAGHIPPVSRVLPPPAPELGEKPREPQARRERRKTEAYESEMETETEKTPATEEETKVPRPQRQRRPQAREPERETTVTETETEGNWTSIEGEEVNAERVVSPPQRQVAKERARRRHGPPKPPTVPIKARPPEAISEEESLIEPSKTEGSLTEPFETELPRKRQRGRASPVSRVQPQKRRAPYETVTEESEYERIGHLANITSPPSEETEETEETELEEDVLDTDEDDELPPEPSSRRPIPQVRVPPIPQVRVPPAPSPAPAPKAAEPRTPPRPSFREPMAPHGPQTKEEEYERMAHWADIASPYTEEEESETEVETKPQEKPRPAERRVEEVPVPKEEEKPLVPGEWEERGYAATSSSPTLPTEKEKPESLEDIMDSELEKVSPHRHWRPRPRVEAPEEPQKEPGIERPPARTDAYRSSETFDQSEDSDSTDAFEGGYVGQPRGGGHITEIHFEIQHHPNGTATMTHTEPVTRPLDNTTSTLVMMQHNDTRRTNDTQSAQRDSSPAVEAQAANDTRNSTAAATAGAAAGLVGGDLAKEVSHHQNNGSQAAPPPR
ncbi:unnamed protein product [Vitrella brassicaformis CCMP3155]|uniref:Uncharacterized protein n=2 Tax=Vitrella brassicaformis TaxID=1169539 RepID=A0A0G4EFL3_VITBC|nr:unnamed protein product [Vitrella brassicaformis CCMP3155]|eukprot:CEL94522.1 unnamed protein product [Vitrella brassicaformis CCMP3155]